MIWFLVPLFDLELTEHLWTLIICGSAIVSGVVAWKQEGAAVRDLRVELEVLKQTTASVEDWSEINSRCTVLEKLVTKFITEWEGEPDDAEG